MKKCKKCGAELSEEAMFCSACGENIEQEVPPTPTPKPAVGKKPFYYQWWFWIAVALFCLLLIGTLGGESSEAPSTGEHDGTGTGDTDSGGNSSSTSNEKGSKNNPYVLSADTWYIEHCEKSTQAKYLNKWVKVTGTVLNISDYGNLKGYYLAGGTGKGLVCWIDDGSQSVQYGQIIEYVGKVTVADSNHIEIADGTINSKKWPTVKPVSPVTISNWTWTRDSVGGVEWNFKFTNNTDKIVKYITMEWNCYNAVGDLVYDDITGKYSHGVKYTGPLEAGQTTDLLCNTTLFYDYSYQSSKLTKLQVEFMDGTIIRINDEAYTHIIVQELEAETVIGTNGIKYIVNNNLNTCYIADIGTCTDTYIGILSSLYGDTVTQIDDFAFANADFIEKISITTALESIGKGAFSNCTSLTYINYYGTIEEWNAISKGENWNQNVPATYVQCTDGTVPLN